MYDNKDNGFNQNADTTQNEQEQFADNSTEENDCRYPEKIQKELIANESESAYAFNWHPSSSEQTNRKQKTRRNRLWLQTLIMGTSFILAFVILSSSLVNERRNHTGTPDISKEETTTPSEAETGKII